MPDTSPYHPWWRHPAVGVATAGPAEAPMARLIDLKDVDIYYSDFLAVEGVTMTIPPRAVMAFIGPSGCGKSTVLRTHNRLHELGPMLPPMRFATIRARERHA